MFNIRFTLDFPNNKTFLNLNYLAKNVGNLSEKVRLLKKFYT